MHTLQCPKIRKSESCNWTLLLSTVLVIKGCGRGEESSPRREVMTTGTKPILSVRLKTTRM